MFTSEDLWPNLQNFFRKCFFAIDQSPFLIICPATALAQTLLPYSCFCAYEPCLSAGRTDSLCSDFLQRDVLQTIDKLVALSRVVIVIYPALSEVLSLWFGLRRKGLPFLLFLWAFFAC